MNPYLAVGAVISGVGLLQGGMGLMGALLPLLMREGGYGSFQVGIMVAGFSGGFLVGCLFAPGLVRRIGHIRAFSVFAAFLSATTLAFIVGVDIWYWTGLRLMAGFCMAGMLTVSDSWISGETESSVRGRVMSAYMIIYKLAQTAGPATLTLGELSGNWYFPLASALFSLSLLPVALTHAANPAKPSSERMSIIQVYRLTPAGVVGCIIIGLASSAVNNLTPFYGAEIGLGVGAAALLVAAMQIGALIFQWPMGWLSDRQDRRRIMVAGLLGCSVMSLVILALPETTPLWLRLGVFAVMGGFAMSIYPIIVAHGCDFCRRDQMVPMCATLMLTFAVGMVFGPLGASLMMEYLGPNGLFIFSALVPVFFMLFALYRMTRRRSRPLEERDGFVNMPVSSIGISKLDPRADVSS